MVFAIGDYDDMSSWDQSEGGFTGGSFIAVIWD